MSCIKDIVYKLFSSSDVRRKEPISLEEKELRKKIKNLIEELEIGTVVTVMDDK